LRKFLTILFILVLAVSLSAQVRTGRIYGKITDEDGNALPGVNVSLTGSLTAPAATVSSATGVFRFLSLPAASDYTVKAELEGFKTEIKENIIVAVGANVEINLAMKMGALEEEVTVTAITPVVDTKKTTVTSNVNRNVLQSLPTARDPWVILQQVPGVMIDRENVGGSESGQQSGYMAMGGGQDQWSMDGITITDPASISSPGYYDFDAFEEMNITTGGADVTIQGAGVQVNLVTRRGGNRTSLGGRFFFTDGDKFQAENLTDALRAEGVVGTNHIKVIKDFGFNAGGPIWKDKAWWWVSYGVQDIHGVNMLGKAEGTNLDNYAAKINIQPIPENRLELFAHIGGKVKQARSSWALFPAGFHQTGAFHFGSPIVKIQDEHMFGDNLFMTIKVAYGNSGFNLIPENDLSQSKLVRVDNTTGMYLDSYWAYTTVRPQNQYNFMAQYFNDDLLGASHEFKFGAEYSTVGSGSRWAPPGNAWVTQNYNSPVVDVTGDNVPDIVQDLKYISFYRRSPNKKVNLTSKYTVFLSDTITAGRLTLNLGARYDKQVPSLAAYSIDALDGTNPAIKNNFSSAAITAMENALPALKVDAIKPDYNWSYITPRLGATYDLFGDGKTMIKISYSQFREYMSTGVSSWFSPRGTGGWMDFAWFDAASLGGNGDGIVDLSELYWYTPTNFTAMPAFDGSGNLNFYDIAGAEGQMWGGFDIMNPQTTSSPRYTLRNPPAYRTTEIIFTLEKEVLTDFGVALDLNYRKMDKYRWDLYWIPGNEGSIENQAEYSTAVGTVPSTIPGVDLGEGAGKPYYLRKAGIGYRYYRIRTERPDYNRKFMSVQVRFNKRLSNKWMFNGSVTLQKNNVYYGASGYLNPTNLWVIDKGPYTPNMGGGSGKISVPFHQTWMVKFSGLYQLPYNFDVSFTASGRQGNPLLHQLYIYDYNAPNPYNRGITVYLDKKDKERLPNFYRLDLRLQKSLKLGSSGRMYFMADLFNVFNSATLLRRHNYNPGTYYPHNGYLKVRTTSYLANEVFNPRVIRFGIRFQFN